MICSYFACRNAGIKFRYCSHCKVPVAKRNFRKRHKHGGEIIGDKGDDSGDDETPKKGIPSQITASRDEEEDEDGISSQSADSTNHGGVESKKAPAPKATLPVPVLVVQSSMVTSGTTKPSEVDQVVAVPSNGKINDERLSHWISLLAKRPSTKDSDTMSTWLMEVLAVSDLETPLPELASKSDSTDKHRDAADGRTHTLKDEEEKEKLVENGGNIGADMDGSILKKKRPFELLEGQESGETKDESNGNTERELTSAFASGSFAEWKERKKQKMQSKGLIGPGM